MKKNEFYIQLKLEFGIDGSQTLTQLESSDWGQPEYESHLVTECYKLRHKPLYLFDAENLRIMLSQKISIKFLIPMAILILRKEPDAAGDFIEGSLLKAVLSADPEYYVKNPSIRHKIKEIVDLALKKILSTQLTEDLDIQSFEENVKLGLAEFSKSQLL